MADCSASESFYAPNESRELLSKRILRGNHNCTASPTNTLVMSENDSNPQPLTGYHIGQDRGDAAFRVCIKPRRLVAA